jgi:hypothetical protein
MPGLAALVSVNLWIDAVLRFWKGLYLIRFVRCPSFNLDRVSPIVTLSLVWVAVLLSLYLCGRAAADDCIAMTG